MTKIIQTGVTLLHHALQEEVGQKRGQPRWQFSIKSLAYAYCDWVSEAIHAAFASMAFLDDKLVKEVQLTLYALITWSGWGARVTQVSTKKPNNSHLVH